MADKSQSQKIRNALFLIWRKESEGFTEFEDYYNSKTNKYLDFLLKKLDGTPPPTTQH